MSSLNLTARETVLLGAIVSHSNIQVNDWNAVAKLADFTTAKYARDTFTTIKKKLAAAGTAASGSAGATSGDGEDSEAATPAAKKKGTPASKRKATSTTDPTETPTKKRGRPAKTKKPAFDSDDEENARSLAPKKKGNAVVKPEPVDDGAETAHADDGDDANAGVKPEPEDEEDTGLGADVDGEMEDAEV